MPCKFLQLQLATATSVMVPNPSVRGGAPTNAPRQSHCVLLLADHCVKAVGTPVLEGTKTAYRATLSPCGRVLSRYLIPVVTFDVHEDLIS